jgi:3-hydroxyisobutyrate dehydrogenase
MTQASRIGFIGIGNMGSLMAANLARAGYAVTAYDIDGERARSFAAAHSAHATESLAHLGQNVDVVITMLPTGREVRHALLEAENGALAANLHKGSIVIDMSSADPVGTRRLGAELAAHGIALVDAPVSGGVVRAKDASLTIMIGGDPQAIAAVKPILAAMGQKLFGVGNLGCGHAMKALNNFLAGTSFAAATEAVNVGREFGLDPAVMMDVISVSTGRSFATELMIKQHVLSGVFGTGFSLGLLAKDVKIAADLADQIGVDAPVSRLVCDMWSEARDALGTDQDHTKAATHWEHKGQRRAAE